MARSMKQQAFILTLGNVFTRGAGFLLHLLFARLMGAEALGVMELVHSVGMLALTPVTSGVSTAMSRLTAGRSCTERPLVLKSALHLIRRIALITMAAMLLLSPLFAWLLGDMRTLPAIWADIPCVLLLGLCSVYGGYCFGLQDTLTPALNECVEQVIRFVLSALLLLWLGKGSIARSAALPEFAELIAASLSLVLFVRLIGWPGKEIRITKAIQRDMLHLCIPSALSRLCVTVARALNAVLLPVCLRRSGLSAAAATAQFGLYSGMAMPLLMLPGMLTGAVCMVSTPAVSRLEHKPRALRRLAAQLMLSACAIGIAACIVLAMGAKFLSIQLYRQAALAPLLRLLAPCSIVMALNQVTGGMIAGLGLQPRALAGTLFSSAASLLLTALLCPLPGIRLFGAALAAMAGQILGLVWNLSILMRSKAFKTG